MPRRGTWTTIATLALVAWVGCDAQLTSESSRGGVVAEITASDRARRLSVRAGRYFVRGRGADHLLEGELELRAGDDRLVADEELRRVEYARLVRKGSTVLRSVSGVEAGGFLRSALISGRSPAAVTRLGPRAAGDRHRHRRRRGAPPRRGARRGRRADLLLPRGGRQRGALARGALRRAGRSRRRQALVMR